MPLAEVIIAQSPGTDTKRWEEDSCSFTLHLLGRPDDCEVRYYFATSQNFSGLARFAKAWESRWLFCADPEQGLLQLLTG